MSISLDANKEVYAQESGDYPIFLMTFSSPGLANDIRVSTDATTRLPGLTTDEQVVWGTVSNSLEYMFCPMAIAWPAQQEGVPPETKLTISNIGRELVAAIRSLGPSPSLKMDYVLASNTDRIEQSVTGLLFLDADINTMNISGALKMDDTSRESCPFRTFGPSTARGLFKK
ncbi:MAG: DUF1833 family protein [Desulforhopalus sp.]